MNPKLYPPGTGGRAVASLGSARLWKDISGHRGSGRPDASHETDSHEPGTLAFSER